MTKQNNQPEPLTKDDVEEIVNRVVNDVVTDVVSGVSTEILNAMAEQFKDVNRQFEKIEGRLNSIENILRPTIGKVDDHEVRLKRLEVARA